MGWQTFFVKDQIADISPCDHIDRSLSYSTVCLLFFFFKQHFKNAKSNLCLQAVQNLIAGKIWLAGCRLPAHALKKYGVKSWIRVCVSYASMISLSALLALFSPGHWLSQEPVPGALLSCVM